MNAADRKALTALAEAAAGLLDVPRPLVKAPGPGATQEDHEAWFKGYKSDDAAYESLVRSRIMDVRAAQRYLASTGFAEGGVQSVTGGLAEALAAPLPYATRPEVAGGAR